MSVKSVPLDADEVLAFLRSELLAIKPVVRDATSRSAQLDSLDLVELVARIERHYELMIPDDDLPEMVSLDAIARYVLARARP